MKQLLILTFLLLLLHNLKAQTIHDSVFNNVILIETTDVTTNGKDFLIDIPIKPQNESIVIFNSDERIPTNFFLDRTFLPEQYEILLIIPDWEYYKSIDRFHSRLEISPDDRYLMSKGWQWHPLDIIMVFDIKQCLRNPQSLDEPQFYPNVGVEICTASFVNGSNVLIGSSDEIFDDDNIGHLPPKHICLWNIKTNELSKPVTIKENFGKLFVIDATRAWDLFSCPKIIDINTGEVIERDEDVKSGKQQSAMINKRDYFPSIIFNKLTGQIAIKADEEIEVLTPG